MISPPSERVTPPDEGGDVSELSGNLDRAADDFMRRARAADPKRFAEIAARHPTVPLRSLSRPRQMRDGDAVLERADVPYAEGSDEDGEASEVDRQQYREWLQGQGLVP